MIRKKVGTTIADLKCIDIPNGTNRFYINKASLNRSDPFDTPLDSNITSSREINNMNVFGGDQNDVHAN
jgi:hypothetical protein